MYSILRLLCDGLPRSADELAKNTGLTAAAAIAYCRRLVAGGYVLDIFNDLVTWLDPFLLMDEASIFASVDRSLWNRIESIAMFPVIGSTSDQVKGLSFTDGYALCLAESQTEGRGRRGNQWRSPAGANIMMSIAYQTAPKADFPQGLSLAVGLCVASALRQAGFEGVGVKWPNDLYIDGDKLGGVLVEVSSQLDGSWVIVIGVGLNVNWSPPQGDEYGCTSLRQHFGEQDRSGLIGLLCEAIMLRLDNFFFDGVNFIHANWPAFDITRDKIVRVLRGADLWVGRGAGIDRQFRFLLAVDGVTRAFDSADVSVRLP